MKSVTIVGAGLAGTEAAWQLAERGIDVELIEQKPLRRTPAQTSDWLAELVCSNSFRGAALGNAVGLLKEEMRRAGSMIIAAADATRVPAGGALAVDRERFGATVTRAIATHPRIRRTSAEVTSIPAARPVIIATGPLTGDALAEDIARAIGGDHLAYYDAISPIVSAESINWERVFRASRYDKGGDDAYVNCPFDEAQYRAFVEAILSAEKVAPRAFESVKYFEGCLPVEVMAERGPQTLSHGPMKPVGLTDPRTGRWPHAVVQLRQEDAAATAYNIVGFQSRMTWTEQARIFRMIPGLENAEFQRFGSVHRNTFIDAPRVLGPALELNGHDGIYFAGQITGVEGYLESAACGFLCALMLAYRLEDRPFADPPETTALGGLLNHLRTRRDNFQPSNVTWSMVPPIERTKKMQKRDRYEAMALRALEHFAPWCETVVSGRSWTPIGAGTDP